MNNAAYQQAKQLCKYCRGDLTNFQAVPLCSSFGQYIHWTHTGGAYTYCYASDLLERIDSQTSSSQPASANPKLSDMVCCECPAWDRLHGAVGVCRFDAPTSNDSGDAIWPCTRKSEWCLPGRDRFGQEG